MMQIVFVDKQTHRVIMAVMGSEEVCAVQPIPEGAYAVETTADIPYNSEYMHDNGVFIYSPQPLPMNYIAHRLKAYPGLGDFIDAFYWQVRGNPQPMEVYLAKIDTIKAQYPKPT